MSDVNDEAPAQSRETSQPLIGFMTNAEWSELLAQADALVHELEQTPYPNVKEQVFELLGAIDLIHREALRRLVRLFKAGVLETVITDPAIHTLMELYDLLPPAAKDKNGDEQRAKIVFTTSAGKRRPAGEEKPKPKYPRWIPVSVGAGEMTSGVLRDCLAEDRRILLCRVGESLFALEARCSQDGAPLAGATLSKFTLTCPHHAGCYYDVRDGARIAASGRLECLPVKDGDGGRILVGLDMDFTPLRSSF